VRHGAWRGTGVDCTYVSGTTVALSSLKGGNGEGVTTTPSSAASSRVDAVCRRKEEPEAAAADEDDRERDDRDDDKPGRRVAVLVSQASVDEDRAKHSRRCHGGDKPGMGLFAVGAARQSQREMLNAVPAAAEVCK
jgi:hypothetical protein